MCLVPGIICFVTIVDKMGPQLLISSHLLAIYFALLADLMFMDSGCMHLAHLVRDVILLSLSSITWIERVLVLYSCTMMAQGKIIWANKISHITTAAQKKWLFIFTFHSQIHFFNNRLRLVKASCANWTRFSNIVSRVGEHSATLLNVTNVGKCKA